MKITHLVAALIVAYSANIFAQAKLKLDQAKSVKIEYSSPSWNKNPKEVDSSSVLFRDANSGKIARVELQETGTNTGKFVGIFRIQWPGTEEITPELYIPPQGMFATPEQMKKIEDLIRDGILLRKPFFMSAETKASQAIALFDTKDQAQAAFEQYRKTALGRPVVDKAAIEAQKKAEALAEANRMAEAAKIQEAERVRLAMDEIKRQEELKRQQAALDAAEKARRQAEAKKLAEEGMKLYAAGKYPEAEKKFERATELDPSNSSFYFQYGVTLFRNEKFNRSIVVLKMANGPGVNALERDYFLGLNLLKTKEYEAAYTEFAKIKSKNNKALSASAAFFMGVIDFQKERYEVAKGNFEYTLDNSEDPAMDKQAEAYIEQIANILAFQKEREKKFILGFNIGMQMDSNILSTPNSQVDAGSATGLDGYRWSYGGSIEYRPVYSEHHEWSTGLSVNDMYSMDKNFKAKTEFQNTDPLMTTLNFPYKYKTMFLGKPFQLGVTPQYETINMNADGTGSREVIVNSTVLKVDQTYVMSGDWFSAYNLEYRSDASKIDTTATPEADQSGSKISLMTTNTLFKNKDKTEATIYEAGFSSNTAKGQNSTFSRFDLAASYMMPAFWKSALNARLGLYSADYNKHLIGRKDTNTSLTVGLRKPLSETWAWTVGLNYTINKSTLDANDYKKYLVMTSFSWNGSL